MSEKRAEILSWLAEQERLCDAATRGPWEAAVLGAGRRLTVSVLMRDLAGEGALIGWNGFDSSDTSRPAQARNARFIAAARTVLPMALAALRGQAEAHEEARVPDGRGLGYCWTCGEDGAGTPTDWPCPLIERIHAATVGAA